MIKVMIADDDYYVRMGLSTLIAWEKLGAEVVCLASNGVELVEALEKERAELLILDIRMPLMDGLEVAKYVHDNMPSVQVVLLSAFSEFEYAHKALSLGVQNYILKPINQEKINKLSNIVRDVAQEVELTKTISEGIHNGFFKERLGEYLRNEDPGLLDKILYISEQYKNLDVYREFGTHILETLNAITDSCGDSAELRSQFVSCNTIRDMKEFLYRECMKHIKNSADLGYGKNEKLVQRVSVYVRERLSDSELNVQSVAERFELVPDYLSRLFRQQMGVSLQEFIIDVRLKNATDLLKNSDLTIMQISKSSGYENTQHFVKLFKKRYSVTPTQYRQGVANQ